jgi:purine-nucleoside phosphorylase
MPFVFEQIDEAKQYIEKKISIAPEIGIILGTGLGRLVNEIEIVDEIVYSDIPHFPVSTVETHEGKLIAGNLGGKKVLAMQGRFHHYEGYSLQQVAFPVQVMKLLGIQKLVVSNAAGGINPQYAPGSLMVITDHINLLGSNPLIGKNDERIGPRWPDMSEPYSQKLIDMVSDAALEHKIRIEKGVYAAMSGPCLETKAEYRMLKILGADAIGMSTVPEVIAAVHAGIEVLGISVITDSCLPDALEPVNIQQIIEYANKAEPKLVILIKEVLKKL